MLHSSKARAACETNRATATCYKTIIGWSHLLPLLPTDKFIHYWKTFFDASLLLYRSTRQSEVCIWSAELVVVEKTRIFGVHFGKEHVLNSKRHLPKTFAPYNNNSSGFYIFFPKRCVFCAHIDIFPFTSRAIFAWSVATWCTEVQTNALLSRLFHDFLFWIFMKYL